MLARLSPNGYTKAADLWSFGMLIAFMLTGEQKMVDGDDEMETQTILEDALADFFDRTRAKGVVARRAFEFIQDLLVTEPSRRLTTGQAINHEWLTKPLTEAAELRLAYQRVIGFWQEREPEESVIEEIQQDVTSPRLPVRATSKRRARFLDTSSFSYNGLEHRLYSQKASNRQKVLADLNGRSFITEVDSQPSVRLHSVNHRQQRSESVQIVNGSDMFGQSSQVPASQLTTQDETQNETEKTVMNSRCTNADLLHRNACDGPTSGTFSLAATPSTAFSTERTIKSAYFRTESEDRRVHDAALNALPPWTTAKKLREMKEKVALDSNQMAVDA